MDNNKYEDGKIYEIISDNTDMVYIGSCIVTLKKRLIQHKCKANPTASKSIIDYGDYTINLIEKYPCNNDLELRMREQMYIDIYKNDGKNVINGRNAYTSLEDRKENKKENRKNNKENHKEYMKQYSKQYYQNNKERAKQWYENNKENRKEGRKEYHKEYYKNNKNKVIKKSKEWRDSNKETEKERGLFRSKRVCNGFYNLSMMLNEY